MFARKAASLASATDLDATRAWVQPLCAHCGNDVPTARASSPFCCRGCETVHALLLQRGLGRYYEIRSKDRPIRKPRPAELAAGADRESFAYLDDPEFRALYATQTDGLSSMKFFLEGVHCAACVWLTERVGEFVPGVEQSRLDLGDSVARITISESGSFAAVARELARLGYHPHPVRADEADEHGRRADRWLLARTGVAGACAGNIMLLAVSLYAGADGKLAETFRWASFVLSLPVLLFSALPFYRGAWAAVRARQASIDLPIALGIGLGAVSSVYNLASGSPYLYFDSLATLVFLMLASRYLLVKTQRAAMNSSRLIRFLTPASARVAGERPGLFRDVPVDQVRAGDQIEVLTGECIPVDGVIEQGRSAIDSSLLTGESVPVLAGPGEPVFAGTVNQLAPLTVRATASGSATRLGRTLRAAQEDLGRKAGIVTFADRVARLFVSGVLISVVIVFVVGLRQGLHEAVNLALALSIVTCPCAFALATPLALSISMGRCAREGVLIRSADVIERLSTVREVVFDKTGTLTVGRYGVEHWDAALELETDSGLLGALVALESRSRHPVARAIVEHFAARVPRLPEVEGFRERLGEGVSGRVGGRFYEIRSDLAASDPGTWVGIWRDGAKLGSLRLGDRLRDDTVPAFQELKHLGLRLGILSGDAQPAVQWVAARLGLAPWRWHASLSPEQKRQSVAGRDGVLFVGDGANDAAALAAAHVSVAVHGGVEVSLQSADAYCRRPGVGQIAPLLVVARETLRVIRRNFVFSLVYNAVGIAGVICGWVTPLFAAVLMPVSAITVFLSSLAGTAGLRAALREMRR